MAVLSRTAPNAVGHEQRTRPRDYDGILAGAPAIQADRFLPAAMWPQVVMYELDDFVHSCEFDAINEAVTAACDSRDGVTTITAKDAAV
ncbi:tannase/feruloyl esterase family alpha/beta hydrolase [Streptomyces sp. NPDC047461]|uniref:tannase/feruloyl esterase family alpha/beta hydrolase n=1 Tax=Streptomyces sp. NPDC047461 TaxID=3155619 RepID=UPI0033DB443E